MYSNGTLLLDMPLDIQCGYALMFVVFEISVPQLSFSKWKSIESTESVELM